MTEPQTHSYALGEPVAFEDPTSGWADYVTGEITALLDTGVHEAGVVAAAGS